jgi:hypothetical protein
MGIVAFLSDGIYDMSFFKATLINPPGVNEAGLTEGQAKLFEIFAGFMKAHPAYEYATVAYYTTKNDGTKIWLNSANNTWEKHDASGNKIKGGTINHLVPYEAQLVNADGSLLMTINAFGGGHLSNQDSVVFYRVSDLPNQVAPPAPIETW